MALSNNLPGQGAIAYLTAEQRLSDELLKQLSKQLLPRLADAHAGGQHLLQGRVKSEHN